MCCVLFCASYFLSRQGRGMAGKASCAKKAWHSWRAADGWMVCVIIVKASHVSDGASELQSASSLLSSVKRWFVLIPLARFPFLLSQVFTFVYKIYVKPYMLRLIEVPKEASNEEMLVFPKDNHTCSQKCVYFLRKTHGFWGGPRLVTRDTRRCPRYRETL